METNTQPTQQTDGVRHIRMKVAKVLLVLGVVAVAGYFLFVPAEICKIILLLLAAQKLVTKFRIWTM